MDIEPLKLLGRWETMGYRMENMVEVPGTISHRGGIVDIFPPTSDMPVRLDFFGDTIDNIRYFNPETQRSVESLSSVAIGPATELLALWRMDKPALEWSLRSLDLKGCTDEVKQQFERDKRHIKGDNPYRFRQRLQVAGIGSLHDDHLLVLAQLPRQLAVSHINSIHTGGTSLEQTICETASRCPDVRADGAPD